MWNQIINLNHPEIKYYNGCKLKYLLINLSHFNRCSSNSTESQTGKEKGAEIPCVTETYFILYMPETIWLDKECNKLMQGVHRGKRATCFHLNSPVALGHTTTATMPFSIYDAVKCSSVHFAPLTGCFTDTAVTKTTTTTTTTKKITLTKKSHSFNL